MCRVCFRSGKQINGEALSAGALRRRSLARCSVLPAAVFCTPCGALFSRLSPSTYLFTASFGFFHLSSSHNSPAKRENKKQYYPNLVAKYTHSARGLSKVNKVERLFRWKYMKPMILHLAYEYGSLCRPLLLEPCHICKRTQNSNEVNNVIQMLFEAQRLRFMY
jgi:hypothetical protein